VRVRGVDTYTTSLDVAAFCRKRHADVLRAIENLNCSETFNQRNFALVSYAGANGVGRERIIAFSKSGSRPCARGASGW
jgi:phage regulator Rha-like protein